jgi:F-type H+-transporting ATPase subunit epsilon
MNEKINFDLLSPSKKLVGKAATMVTMPGSEGEFGVLAGHALLMANLQAGVVQIYDGQTITDRIFIAGGFAEVSATQCTLLAQDAIYLADLSKPQLEIELSEANKLLAANTDPAEEERLATHQAIIMAKLLALNTAQ